MGGKTKQAQRTKNNARPSSSGRSAELLGSAVPPFVGFTAVENCGFVPVVPGFVMSENLPEDIDPNVDANYQLVLRKMTKKDPITKVKALQEFSEMIASSELDLVKTILPFWPRLYANLATDIEHRVREGAQQAQAAVTVKAGKNIAPFLRQLAPAWITSQYDTYAPAASLATSSFQKAFPQHKLKEVFTFCQNEILDYITKILTVHTSTTLSNPKSYTAEECEAKYQRAVICSLQAYALYLQKITGDDLKEAITKNTALIDHQKFWSFHKHKSPNIRSAWYEAISSVLQNASFLIEKHEQQVATCVLQNIDENEPIVQPHIWTSVLLVQTKINNWASYINMEKALLPKLWKLLKSGSAIVYPHILPLISRLNKDVLGDKIVKFYENLFENLGEGLRSRSGQLSKSETTAIASAYYECLQYVIIQIQCNEILPSEINLTEFCTKLLDDHIISIVNWIMTNDFNSGRYVYTKISLLLSYWCQNIIDYPLYEIILKRFWSEVYRMTQTSLENSKNIDKTIESQIELIQILKSSVNHKTSRQAKVKFSNEDTDQTDSSMVQKNHTLEYETELFELVCKLCNLYMEKTNELKMGIFINNMELLLKEFGNAELLKKLAGSDDISQLYDKFETWLHDDGLRQESVVDIILYLYKFLNQEQKTQLLDKLVKFPNSKVQNWVITRLLSHPLCLETDINKILSQSHVSEHLVECAETVTRGTSKENLNLLHKCFFQSESGEILIDRATCERIIEVISKTLTDVDSKVIDTCGSFLAQIMPVICSDDEKLSLKNSMFLQLFQFSVNKSISDTLSEDTLWEITTSWQDALSSEDLKLTENLLGTCSEIIDEKLYLTNDITTVEIDSLAEVASKLIICSSERLTEDEEKMKFIDKIIDVILNHRSKEYRDNTSYMKYLCLLAEGLNSSMTVPSISDGDEFTKIDHCSAINDFFKLSTFKIDVIFKLCCNIKRNCKTERDDEDELTEEEYTEDYCDMEEHLLKNISDEMYDQILEAVYAFGIGESLIVQSTQLSETTETLILHLGAILTLFIKHIKDDVRNSLREKIFQMANQNGSVWAKCLLLLLNFEQYDNENGSVLLYEDAATTVTENENILAYVNILQVLTPKITLKCLPISSNLFEGYSNILIPIAAVRCLIQNNFNSNFNEVMDRKIITNSLNLLADIIARVKINELYLLYSQDVTKVDTDQVILVTEIINLISDVLRCYPTELDLSRWDLIRIALSSWVLSVSKSSNSCHIGKVAIFIANIYKLFTVLSDFIATESTKSSTEQLSKVIEEWNCLFAKDVNLVLLKSYINMVNKNDTSERNQYFLDTISPFIEQIDYNYILKYKQIDSKTSMDDLVRFCLQNISHKYHSVRMASTAIIKKMAKGFIALDLELLNKKNEQTEEQKTDNSWHFLNQFKGTIDQQNDIIREYVEDFNFKLTEFEEMPEFPRNKSIPYLLLWDCIVELCAKAPSELRSIYASWITENKYEHVILPTMFRLMPVDVLKHLDTKYTKGQTFFTNLEWKQICNPKLSADRFSCHMYSHILRHLPALVRKWWQDLGPRQKTLVDKITTNFVSGMLCQEELRTLTEEKEKYDNMQISVHNSTREVIANYSIEDARMELIVTLPLNYPLGSVKVESGRQIGGRLQSRAVVMQLTIFLTHQNGTILDGLSLWKKNLDKKFEGVEECYVCYSVIHQDTCQLPKLSCKTCRKKFHGPCLYKWFSTSSKSTCPICRNIF